MLRYNVTRVFNFGYFKTVQDKKRAQNMSNLATFTYDIFSKGVLFFGTAVFDKKQNDETHEQFEERTWKKKVRQLESGQVYIQPFALKNALESAGSRLNKKLTGKSTYTKLFRQGIVVNDEIPLFKSDGKPVTIADIEPVPMFVPSDGKRGSGKRVMRIFPQLKAWHATVELTCLDARLTKEVVLEHLEEAGKFIGFGSMRAENGGVAGRFSLSE